jgi:hypothetical protein
MLWTWDCDIMSSVKAIVRSITEHKEIRLLFYVYDYYFLFIFFDFSLEQH